MLNNYPSWVRDWINTNGGLRRHLIAMHYSYARRFIQSCANETVF